MFARSKSSHWAQIVRTTRHSTHLALPQRGTRRAAPTRVANLNSPSVIYRRTLSYMPPLSRDMSLEDILSGKVSYLQDEPEEDGVELQHEGFDKQGVCYICRYLNGLVDVATSPAAFIASADDCQWCAALLKAVSSVVDVSRPYFNKIEIHHGATFLPLGVVEVRLRQHGIGSPWKLHKKFEDPFPNSYMIYTPPNAGEKASIPGVGLREGMEDNYRELDENIKDRLKIAKSWLDECVSDHSACRPLSDRWPKRVLELSDDTVFLREHGSKPHNATFIALSYCWGKDGNVKTLKSNIETHKVGIKISTLPKTMQDAIRICKALDVQFLWIDALCITQDDKDDWTEQIGLMADNYAGAHLVVAAEAADNVHEGCLEPGVSKNAPYHRVEFKQEFGDEVRKLQLSIQESPMPHTVARGHHSSRPDPAKELGPLHTRAWAFQERFLAKRILFCTDSELTWHCSEHMRCECSKRAERVHPKIGDYWSLIQLSAVDHSKAGAPNTALQKLSIWCEVVRQYSDCDLTNWTDRIAAMQGVVAALSEMFPDCFDRKCFIAGLWEPFLPRLLSWKRLAFEDLPSSKSMKGIVPSWSWLGASGPIEYSPICFSEEAQTLVDVLEVTMSALSDAFGAMSGRILLEAMLVPVSKVNIFGELEIHIDQAFVDPEMMDFQAGIDVVLDDGTDPKGIESITHFVPLIYSPESPTKVEGILVAPVPGHPNDFRRVGHHFGHSEGVRIPESHLCIKFQRQIYLV